MFKPSIFVSYSHQNKRLKKRIETHLKATGVEIDVWSDTKIQAGDDWYDEIKTAMEKASIAVLIITADFLASDFILKEEIPKLLQRREEEGMIIFPIIAKHCAWNEHEWLKKMQVRPLEAKPVWSGGGRNVAKELTNIVREITGMINGMTDEKKTDDIEKITKIPFTNREEEIERIMADYAPAYYLIDAPTGYGKTELLKKLQKNFEKREWISARMTCNQTTQPEDVVNLLAEVFSVDLPNVSNLSHGVRLGSALQRKFEKLDDVVKGVVLLVDLDKKPSSRVLEELLGVVQSARAVFGELSFFTKGHNRFRMIIAGRSLANLREVRDATLPFSVLKLSPFNYKIIKRAVRETREYIDENHRNNLSAHLFYMTGGHPLCVTEILQNYTKHPVSSMRFSEQQDLDIWNGVVQKVAADVKRDFYRHSLDLDVFSNWLGIFRYLDYYVLKQLLVKNNSVSGMDEYDFADLLTSTYMLDWDERVLRDDIARRLLAIGLRHTNKDFEKNCAEAQQICSERLLFPSTNPEIWFIEYLFQSLQMNAKNVFDKRKRLELKKKFFKEHLMRAWDLFSSRCITHKGDIVVERRTLNQALENDWEFRFTVNYYLREDNWDETSGQPFNFLRKKIDLFFDDIVYSLDVEI